MYNWKTPKRNVQFSFLARSLWSLFLSLVFADSFLNVLALSDEKQPSFSLFPLLLQSTKDAIISGKRSWNCYRLFRPCGTSKTVNWSNSVQVFVRQKALHLVFFCRKRHPIFVPKIGMFYCKDVQKKIESNIFISQCILITSQCYKYLVLY